MRRRARLLGAAVVLGCALPVALVSCRQGPEVREPAGPTKASPTPAPRTEPGTQAPPPITQPTSSSATPSPPLNPLAPSAPTAAATRPGPARDRVTLVFAASQAGQIVPCGCSPDQRGGLPREGGLLAQWRKEDPGLVFVDAGDTLFAAARPVTGPAAEQARLKAQVLASAGALLGAAAHVLGARDLAEGASFPPLAHSEVPLLDAGGLPVPGARATLLVRAGGAGIPVGLFGAGLGEKPEATIATRAAALRAEGARLVVLVLHPQGDRALTAAQALLPAARAAGVDLVVLGRRDDPSTDPDAIDPGNPPLLAVEGHGQSVLRIDLEFPRQPAPPEGSRQPTADRGQPAPALFLARGAAGKSEELAALDERIGRFQQRLPGAAPELKAQLEAKIAELQQRRTAAQAAVEQPPPGAIMATPRIARLTKEVPEDPALQALVARYDEAVTKLNLAAAQTQPATCPKPAKGERAFVGVSGPLPGGSCVKCHQTEAAFWERTRHARAYQTLVNVKKQFSLDCITCHVTGWQQPGGVCRIDKTAPGGPGLAAMEDPDRLVHTPGGAAHGPAPERLGVGRQDVQCENCHGPASEHAKDPPGHIADKVPERTCVRCHEAENSPHFAYQRYLPWVIGPGHGEPLITGTARTRGEIETGRLDGPNGGTPGGAK